MSALIDWIPELNLVGGMAVLVTVGLVGYRNIARRVS